MIKYFLLAALVGALVLLSSGFSQKNAVVQSKGVSITIKGKKVKDGTYVRKLGKDNVRAVIKDNVIVIEGNGDIGVLIGFREFPQQNDRPSGGREASSRDTLDLDGDGVRNQYDACPLDFGPANPNPLLNGCPATFVDALVNTRPVFVF